MHDTSTASSRELAEWLARDGQLLVPLVELLEKGGTGHRRSDRGHGPGFADVQAQAQWTFGPGQRLALFGLTSRENADFRFDAQDDEESRETGRLFSEAGNDLASLRFDALLGGAATSHTIVSWYRNTDLLGVDATFESSSRRSNAPDDEVAAGLTNVAFDRDLSVRDLSLRQELALALSPAHTLETGVELHRLASGAGISITGDRNETVANPSSVRGGSGLPDDLDSSLEGTRGGAWLQDSFTVTPRLSIEPGLRLDWSTVNGGAVLAPRFAATVALGWASRLRVAGGLYMQSPGYEKLIQSDYFFDLSPAVVTGLRHERATHLVTGFEKDLGAGTLFRVEGYYKTFDGLIVGGLEPEAERRARVARYDFPAELQASVPTAARITSAPVNGGGGRAYGADAYLVRSDPAARLVGWLSYAWGRADRDAYGLRFPFEYDRRHAFNAVGRYPAGRPLEHSRDRAGSQRLSLYARGRHPTGGGRGRAPDASSRPATPPARRSTPSTSAASKTCSADACPTTPAWTCASPTSRADLPAGGPGT